MWHFDSGEGYTVFSEKFLETSPVCIQPMLAKATSNRCNAFGITYLRWEKVIAQEKLRTEKNVVRICERNNSADSKVGAEGGGGGAAGTGADSPAACGADQGETAVSPQLHTGAQLESPTLWSSFRCQNEVPGLAAAFNETEL